MLADYNIPSVKDKSEELKHYYLSLSCCWQQQRLSEVSALTDDLVIWLVQWGEIKLAAVMNPAPFPQEKSHTDCSWSRLEN